MLRFLKRLSWYNQAFWAMSADRRRQALRRFGPRRVLRGLGNKAAGGLINGMDRTFGPARANRIYWHLGSRVAGWKNTENRLAKLAAMAPETIEDFVQRGFFQTQDAILLNGLSWNAHSQPILARLLADPDLTAHPALADRIRKSRRYAAVLLISAARLLPDEQARQIATLVSEVQTTLPEDFFTFLDSAGTRLASPPGDPNLRGLLDSGFRHPCRHRLIISENHERPADLAPLFHGAEKVTLIALNDTFGRADFSGFAETAALRELVVEHIRSRVTRFSSAYIENHLDTRDVARAVTARLAGLEGLVAPQEAGALEIAIADFLHFQSLKIRAVAALLDEPDFDHIVITTAQHNSGSSYLRNLAAVPGLSGDPRIEVLSISASMDQKSRFDQCIAGLLTPPAPIPPTFGRALPLPHVVDDLTRAAAAFARRLPDTAPDQTLIFTTQNSAYDASTAAYAAALAADRPVHILHAGANAVALRDVLEAQGADVAVSPFATRFETAPRLKRWLTQLLLDEYGRLAPSPARDALRINVDRVAGEVIRNQMILAQGMKLWFDRLQARECLPQLVVLAPQRAPQILPILPVARSHEVATLALEAHGLNANYCRYVTIQADFYGVISTLFQQTAEADFQIPTSRSFAIGTPRIIAPKGHDPQAARQAARAEMAMTSQVQFDGWAGTVSFFSQPSAWDHMAKVVGSILEAARRLNLQVLVKPHPEETPSRVAAYQTLADSLGAGGLMRVIQSPPNLLIKASDIVLTAYSAAALDAAILQVPVICVTQGEVRYPVDQHSIIGAPLISDVDSLTTALQRLCSDPDAVTAQTNGFFQREPQFLEGPDDRLRALVRQILATPAEDRLRPAETLPDSFFLAEPHPVFPV